MWVERNGQKMELAITEDAFLMHPFHLSKGWQVSTPPELPPEPPIYVPQQITRRQCFIYLHRLGKLATVKAMRQNMTYEEQISFDEAGVVYRTDPIVNAVIQLMDWTPEQADQMFIDAEKI